MSGPLFVFTVCVSVIYFASAAIIASVMANALFSGEYSKHRWSPLSCALLGCALGLLWPLLLLSLFVTVVRKEIRGKL